MIWIKVDCILLPPSAWQAEGWFLIQNEEAHEPKQAFLENGCSEECVIAGSDRPGGVKTKRQERLDGAHMFYSTLMRGGGRVHNVSPSLRCAERGLACLISAPLRDRV